MANPFEDLLNLKIEDQQEAVRTARTIPYSHVATQQNIPFTDKTLSFSVHGRTLERIVYIVIILCLAGYIFHLSYNNNPIGKLDGVQKISGNAIHNSAETQIQTISSPQSNVGAASGINQSTNSSSTNQSNSSQSSQQKTDSSPVQQKTAQEEDFATHFDLQIEDVQYTEDEKGKPIKIQSIKFMMNNRWKDFPPRVEVFW